MTNDLAHDLQNARPVDLAQERIEELVKTANIWIAKVPEIRDEETAKRADDFLNQIQAEKKALDVSEKAEKKPLQDRISEIRDAYLQPRALLNTAYDLLSPRIAAWLRRKRDAAEAEKRRQQIEAARLAREAEEAVRRAAASLTIENQLAAEATALAADKAAAIALAPIDRAQVRGNYSARARSIRTLWRAEVVDQLQLYLYYQNHPDVLAVLQRLADAEAPAAHRDGREILGARLIEREIAA